MFMCRCHADANGCRARLAVCNVCVFGIAVCTRTRMCKHKIQQAAVPKGEVAELNKPLKREAPIMQSAFTLPEPQFIGMAAVDPSTDLSIA